MAGKPELLSPAGGPDAGYAALAYGADAVYLGLKRFSARAEAANFTLDELDAFTAYARSVTPPRRVFAAVNTLVLEAELPDLVADLAAVREVGVDAVIVQDLGVARIVRHHFPTLELHASTQMAVHSFRGVEALARLGVRRVVAARELTLDELRGLCRQSEVEIECFIHGAICYSYSGLCLFSSHALGRSANRGRCAYICGGSFSPEAGQGTPALPFAMKDLALPDRLFELAEAGVASFKIEGRKKNALYVAAVTDFYRSILDGTLKPGERPVREADLRTVFSRPWTELYLGGRGQRGCGDPERVGHRGAPVGAVGGVRGNRRQGTYLRFRTARRLELHDGLQIELPGHVRPYGFSVEELRLAGAGTRTFEAGAGAEVEVRLPPDHPPIPAGAPIQCTSSQAVKRAFRWTTPREGEFRARRLIDVAARLTPERLAVTARFGELEATSVLEDSFTAARHVQAGEKAARAAFERLGNTPFRLGRLTVENPGGLFAAPSQWNGVRRTVAEALERTLAEARVAEVRGILAELRAPEALAGSEPPPARWSLKVDRLELLDGFAESDWEGAELVVALEPSQEEGFLRRFSALAERLGRGRLRLALPAVLRPWDEARLLPRVSRLLDEGWRRWEVSNLAGWGHLGLTPGEDPRGLELTADWPLYVTNTSAGRTLLALGLSGFGLSPEDGRENLKALLQALGPQATVIVYQHTPLFVSETCPRANLAGSCPGRKRCDFRELDLVSDFGNRVRVLNRGCRAVTVGREPFCLSEVVEELRAAGAASLRVDFQWSSLTPEEAVGAWRRVRAGEPVPGSHTGNYFREL
ncbi:MAG: U32 family peptidase [Deltaproteobacteria bacterium]|nr:U32 family peptidase [Deltaproteobacteria bacterium]